MSHETEEKPVNDANVVTSTTGCPSPSWSGSGAQLPVGNHMPEPSDCQYPPEVLKDNQFI